MRFNNDGEIDAWPAPRNDNRNRDCFLFCAFTGDTVEVLPSDRFSVDGIITVGRTAADESSLTGEPVLVPKGPGDFVRAGTVSAGDGSIIRVKATATGAESVLASVIALVEDAQVGLKLGMLVIGWFGKQAYRPCLKERVMVNDGAQSVSIPGPRWLLASMDCRSACNFCGPARGLLVP